MWCEFARVSAAARRSSYAGSVTEERRSNLIGSLLVVAGSVAFGFMGLFDSWTREEQLSKWMLLALRFGIAAPVLWCIVLARGERLPSRGVLCVLIAMGAIGYFAEAASYFLAMAYIPSGLVSLLLYLYPGLVALISWGVLGERLSAVKVGAIALAMVGCGLLLGPALLGSALGVDAWKGVALGTTTAVVYSVYVIAGSRVGKHTTPLMSSAIIVTSAAACFAGVTLVRGDALPQSTMSWLGAVALALVATVLAITAILAGLARIGSVRGSTLAVLEPAVTVLVGVVVLREPFSPWQYLGGACVLVAAVAGARTSKVD